MENPRHSSREDPCASGQIRIANEAKIVMSWSSREKKGDIFWIVYFV